MRKIAVMDTRTIVIGRAGENEAAQVVWPGILAKWRGLYGEGTVQLAARRPGDKEPYPAVCETDGDNVTWVVSAGDTGRAGIGECELSYLVGDTVAKSQTWATMVMRSLTGDGTAEPPEEPAKAWFTAIQAQIGDLDDLTTKAKENLVAAINEAAKTGSGGAGSISMRTADGYIQYSTDDGESWDNLIAVAELKGDPGQDGAPGEDGKPGADGYSPTAKVEKTADGAKITITDKTGTTEATVKNGKDGADGAPGKDGTDGITPTIGDNGNWYLGTNDTGKPSRGEKGDAGAGMDVTGATPGQIAKITAVDTDGKPTAWEPVDMPSGGGEWELVGSQDVSEDVLSVSFDVANAREYLIQASLLNSAQTTGKRGLQVAINSNNSKKACTTSTDLFGPTGSRSVLVYLKQMNSRVVWQVIHNLNGDGVVDAIVENMNNVNAGAFPAPSSVQSVTIANLNLNAGYYIGAGSRIRVFARGERVQ